MKTSLAPGSKVVTDYLERAGLIEPLEQLGFNLVGYGCTTCIGNSGPLPEEISKAVAGARPRRLLRAVGQPQLRGAHQPRGEDELPRLAAAVRRVRARRAHGRRPDRASRSAGTTASRYLRDIWPSQREINDAIESAIESDMFRKSYGEVFEGDETWNALEVPEGDRYAWDPESTYVKRPPYFDGMPAEPPAGFERDRGRARARAARRQRHDRPHLAGGRDQEGLARGPLPDRARRRAAATSTPTARAAATTR